MKERFKWEQMCVQSLWQVKENKHKNFQLPVMIILSIFIHYTKNIVKGKKQQKRIC